jgi:hypothetical protein
MKVPRAGSLLFAVALAAIPGPAATQGREQSKCTYRIDIPASGAAVRRSGKVAGYDYCEYRFSARRGQQIVTTLTGDKRLMAVLYGEVPHEFANGQPYAVPDSGEQIIRILQPRAFARRSSQLRPYTVSIKLK